MKILSLLMMLVLAASCAPKPKYTANTCFQLDPLAILRIAEVREKTYKISLISFLSISRGIPFKDLEDLVEEKGLIAESCDILLNNNKEK